MEEDNIILKMHDDKLQKSYSINLKVGDKYKDDNGFIWKCNGIGYGHIAFVQDINIIHHWTVPQSQRGTPYYILTVDQTKQFLQCPVRNWNKTDEPTRTIDQSN